MPTFTVTSPQGEEFEVEAPEGATREEALEYARSQFETDKVEKGQVATVVDPEEGMEAPFAAQMGRGMMDVYQGTKQFYLNVADLAGKAMRFAIADPVSTFEKLTDQRFTTGATENKAAKSLLGGMASLVSDTDAGEYNRELSAELSLYNQNNPDFQVGRVLGSVATPLALVPGGSAKTLGGKIVAGAKQGTLFSIAQPVDDPTGNPDEYFAQKGEQALWGMGLGGSFPVAGKVLGSVTSWLDEISKPLYKSGIYRDVSKFLKNTITENKGKIIKAIDDAIKRGDKRTVGQIIADTTRGTGDDFGGILVRLEKDLARESDMLKSLYARQSAKRQGFLNSLAGTDDDFASAMAFREANGVKNYTKAFERGVTPDNELKAILDNKYAKIALKEAMDITNAKGAQSNTEVLHYVKLGLDKQLAKSGDLALSKAERSAVDKVKDRLVTWLGNKNEAYNVARQQYQVDSMPINRMVVGRELRNKLINSLEKESPSTFNNALRDSHKLVTKTTGFPRYKGLGDLFSPEEVSQLNKISKELVSESHAAKMAAQSKTILREITGEVRVDLPHILSRPIVVTNHLLKRLSVDRTNEYKQVLTDMIKNPDRFIKAYGGPADWERTKIAMDIVRRVNTIIAAQQAGREAGEE